MGRTRGTSNLPILLWLFGQPDDELPARQRPDHAEIVGKLSGRRTVARRTAKSTTSCSSTCLII